MLSHSPRSKIKGALGPISKATAPTPPVGLAFPVAYIAISPATTRAYRPEKYLWFHKVVNTINITHANSNLLYVIQNMLSLSLIKK